MRIHLTAAAAAFLLTAPSFAQTEDAVEADEDAPTLEARNYNLWVCEAYPSNQNFFGRGPEYKGYSKLFEGGSGAGQQARQQARQRAIRVCEWSTNYNCYSRYDDCVVERFQYRY